MKRIEFRTENILQKLTKVASVVAQKPSIQILSYLHFATYGENKLIITGSDNDTWLQIKLNVDYADTDIKFCVDTKSILSTLKNLSNYEVKIHIDEQTNTLKGEYANGNFSLPYTDADGYPMPNTTNDESSKITLMQSSLLLAVENVEYAIANDELRPIMCGVHFDFFNDKLISVASDGHKLVKHTDTSVNSSFEEKKSFNLPRKPAHILATILQSNDEEIDVKLYDRQAVFCNGEFKMTTRLIEGNFPNYESVIPKSSKANAVVNKNDFVGALNRVLPMGSKSSELVKLNFESGKMTITAEDIDLSTSASEYVSCEYQGDDMKIGFKGSYLAITLQNIDSENVSILLNESSKACVILPCTKKENSELLSLLMPMQIN